MKLKTFLLSTCVLCSLSTIGFSATVSHDEFRGYVDNHKKLIERVKRAASQGGIDEYQQYRDEFLFHTKEYATLKLSNGGAVLNDVNSAKKILHIIISTATKHYLTELSIRHDRVGFYTNYIYSIAQALHRLSDAEYAQILALIDSEITRCKRSLLVKNQLHILKGVIEAVKAKLIDISRKGEPRQRLATYQGYKEKMIAIIEREQARKEAESRLAADHSPSFGSRDEESSSRTSGESYDPRRHASLADLERAQKELERLRRQSGAGGGVMRASNPVDDEYERILELFDGENERDVYDEIAKIPEFIEKESTSGNMIQLPFRKKVYERFAAHLEELAHERMQNFILELNKHNCGIYIGDVVKIRKIGKEIFNKIYNTEKVSDAKEMAKSHYKALQSVFINNQEIRLSEELTGVVLELLSDFTEHEESTMNPKNQGIINAMSDVKSEDQIDEVRKFLEANESFYRTFLEQVEMRDDMNPFAYILDIDPRFFY